jgi:hypothetical protein
MSETKRVCALCGHAILGASIFKIRRATGERVELHPTCWYEHNARRARSDGARDDAK